MIPNRLICWGHGQILELPKADPTKVTASQRSGKASLDSTTVNQKKDGMFRIGVVGGIHYFSYIRFNAQLFPEFPP